jgi:hypothetical protein
MTFAPAGCSTCLPTALIPLAFNKDFPGQEHNARLNLQQAHCMKDNWPGVCLLSSRWKSGGGGYRNSKCDQTGCANKIAKFPREVGLCGRTDKLSMIIFFSVPSRFLQMKLSMPQSQ